MSSEEQKRQLYNRQEYAVGAETQAKYGNTDVLVVGACGLGAEIVKNLTLTGVRSIKVMDSTPVTLPELGTNFFLTESDVGKPRAHLVAERAQELNRFVTVTAVVDPLHEVIPTVHVVVFVNQRTTTLVAENALARKHNVKFVACEGRGIAGCVFVDAGPSFTVVDPDGEETVSCVVTSITRDGVVAMHEDKRHDCEVGSRIFLTGLASPSELNSTLCSQASGASSTSSLKLFEVSEVISPFVLRLKDFDTIVGSKPLNIGYAAYLHTTKQQRLMGFRDLEQSVANPEFSITFDSEKKTSAPATLHAVFRALHNCPKNPSTAVEVDRLIQEAQMHFHSTKDSNGCDSFDTEVARDVLSVIHGRLNPVACFIGGVASQEVLKVCSGKFTPLHQWLYYDARELLEARGDVSEEDRQPQAGGGSRYDEQVAILGRDFQTFLSQQQVFIVGAGALGCELAKNVACMGFGGLSITDMDTIEMSNLSRQFLFRNHHIGQHKSAVAAQAARAINNQMQVRGLIEKVAGETEHIFNEHFWETHSVVLNALDNLESRKYVDSRCIFFRRPLFDSGTLGTKCNVQCVVPYCTESYSSSHDPPEKSIPLCTLKNFPNAIEHTIQWARENFESVFNSLPTDVNAYLGDPTAFSANLERNPGTKATVLRSVHTALSQWPTDAADCVRIARRLHHDYFNVSFKQLLHNLPLDKRNEHGELFWSGAKKPPSPQEFSSDSELHVSFVYHCAQLVARTYGLPPITLSAAEVAEVARLTDVQEFVPCEFRLATSEADKEESAAQAACELSLQDLPPVTQFGSRRMFPQEFEKDDPSNSHMDYITYCSNIRATAYNIPPADLHHTKRIAGKIIPAMVTTTSLVTGLVGVETLKYLLLHRQRERVQGITMRSGGIAVAHPLSVEARRKYLGIFRNAFVNVALPFATFSDPLPDPARIYELPDGSSVSWGIWDRIEVNEGRDVTVEELVALIEQRYQLEVFIIALPSGKMLYSQFGNVKDRKKPVSLVAQQREGGSTSENRCLCLIVTGSIGVVDVDVPLVHYRF